MTDQNESCDWRPEEYGDYLKLIARVEMLKRGWGRDGVSDVVQDALYKACKNLAQFEGKTIGQFKSWLRTILVRTLYDAMKKKWGSREIPISVILEGVEESSRRADDWADFVTSQTTPSQAAMRNEESDRAIRLLANLPGDPSGDQGVAIWLKHCEDWAVARIAKQMNRTDKAVAGLLRRGLETLRKELCEE